MSPTFPKDFSQTLIIEILIPLMEYADTLADCDERRGQGLLLQTLIADVQQRLEVCFSTACRAYKAAQGSVHAQ